MTPVNFFSTSSILPSLVFHLRFGPLHHIYRPHRGGVTVIAMVDSSSERSSALIEADTGLLRYCGLSRNVPLAIIGIAQIERIDNLYDIVTALEHLQLGFVDIVLECHHRVCGIHTERVAVRRTGREDISKRQSGSK